MRLEVVEDILDEFDFSVVQKTMLALEWAWATAEEGIPSLGEMRRQARTLLEDVYNHSPSPNCTMATGGFEATRIMEYASDEKYLSLKFVVSEYNNYE